ncbi:MAG TPA: two-component regulator propeller domain-containing protein, partial [Opitutus sp.]|nr:two-component regulator propeller domain-containing protein [Opitutus sp.]
ASEGLENGFVWALATDGQGRLWAGTWGGGIFRQEGERFVCVEELGTGPAAILFLEFDRANDALWVGTEVGVLRVAREGSSWMLRGEVVCAMAQDKSGARWFALSGAGVARLEGSQITRFGKTEGLAMNGAQCLLPDGDSVWIGTPDGGLCRWKDGRFSTVGVRQGLPSKAVCHIADDRQGHLWLSTHHGIVRASKEELHRCADGEIAAISGLVYDKNDGLPTIEYSGGLQAAGCETPDGRLWFPSAKGLVSVDPRAIRLNTLPPPVVIETLRVSGQAVDVGPARAAELRLAPDHQRLEFQFTALSLSASGKSLFKYRLHGLDTDWIEAGTKRTAFYSQLPPGDYRFQVIASNNDRVWNEEGVTLAFGVTPFYWQTWWFRACAGLLGVTIVGWGARHVTRRRMQRRLEELEYERGIERERARIAQDIHDDIGSNLTRITMLSQSVRNGAGDPYRATAVLERIHDTAVEVTHALDEIVWAVNPRHDTLDSLACYLARYAQERLAEAGVGCRLQLPLKLPPSPLSTQARHNLLLAFKEVLTNVLKHSGATEVQVALTLQPDEFVISVQDNGRGFGSPAGATAESRSADRFRGGHGIENLRRRLAQIGGRCEIHSEPGEGTRILFLVKLPNATASLA